MSANEQTEMEGFRPNPSRYERLSQPFENADAANEAAGKFFDAVERTREEHGIANVVFVIGGLYRDGEGDPLEFVLSGQFGDALKAEGYAAYLYGRMQAQRSEIVAKALRTGGKNR